MMNGTCLYEWKISLQTTFPFDRFVVPYSITFFPQTNNMVEHPTP